ncbi:MAG: acyltransferase [Acidobacteria bacterium]|nr:MAG: acyltransferase [Acidobacteriota bacterium]
MTYPIVPEGLEKFGNFFTRWIGRFILRIMGWRVEGGFPDYRKFVMIVAPHTSNWDFFIGITTVFAIGFRGRWLGKHTIFKKPFGSYMKWMGGIPVDRSKAENVVDQVVERIKDADTIVLGMSPEGTRKKVPHWKTGFYRIARGADVPIVPVTLDYRSKTIKICPPFILTGDQESDIAYLQEFFDGDSAKYPEKY